MKIYILIFGSLLLLFQYPLFSQVSDFVDHQNDTAIVMNSAKFFIEFSTGIHAIAFDYNQKLYVGGGHKVFYVNSDNTIMSYATLTDTTSNTTIWGMTFDKTGVLYVAAKDRVVRIDTNGTQTTLIQEDFGRPSGVSDVRIDSANNLYIVYDNIIARYDTALNKKIVVNGNDFNPPIEWAVGVEFDENNEYIFVGDCNGKKLFIIPYKSSDYVAESKTLPSNWGQYLTKDEHGNIYLSMHGPETFPEFLMVDRNLKRKDIYLHNRPNQTKEIYKKAIAYGQHGSNEKGIYCIIGNKIYVYPIWKSK